MTGAIEVLAIRRLDGASITRAEQGLEIYA
jgi:hypothetical protein